MSLKFHHGQILQGDVLEKLKEIPAESIDCVITSPPYWGLRDYKIEGQWGLEKDFHEYLQKMQEFMNLVKVVLKKTGTCWINLGDTYAGGITHSDFAGLPKELARPWNEGHRFQSKHKKNQVQAKSQFGIPQRFYADCIDNNWIARNFIPWIKENSMPSSVKDRFTNKWEPVMFFAKFQKYYFNLDAVRVKAQSASDQKPFNRRIREAKRGFGKKKMGDLPGAFKMSEKEDEEYDIRGFRKQDVTLGADGKPLAHYKGFNERWKNSKYEEDTQQGRILDRMQQKRDDGLDHEIDLGTPEGFDENGNCFGCGEHFTKHHSAHDKNLGRGDTAEYTPCSPKGKNPGDVLKINPRPFPEAHFATFPIDLPLFILKCACPMQVCKKCSKPREPIMESNNPSKEYADYENIRNFANNFNQGGSNPQSSASLHRQPEGVYSTMEIVGWTSCDCNAGFKPGVVLDPFFGAGTVGLAAEKLGLDWKGIELSEEYINIANKRLEPYNTARIDDYF